MEQTELLQTILQELQTVKGTVSLIDERVSNIDERVLNIEQNQEIMQRELSSVKATQESMQGDITSMKLVQENVIHKQLQLLMEGQQGMNEKFQRLDDLEDKVEDIQITVSVLKRMAISE